jgi:hypothetical protein
MSNILIAFITFPHVFTDKFTAGRNFEAFKLAVERKGEQGINPCEKKLQEVKITLSISDRSTVVSFMIQQTLEEKVSLNIVKNGKNLARASPSEDFIHI